MIKVEINGITYYILNTQFNLIAQDNQKQG